MNIVLKCTREQFEALYNLFGKVINHDTGDIKKSLTADLMKPIYTKLHNRVKAPAYCKSGWNLTVTELQAKTYYTFFDGVYLGPDYLYEQIIIDKHLKEINKILA